MNRFFDISYNEIIISECISLDFSNVSKYYIHLLFMLYEQIIFETFNIK